MNTQRSETRVDPCHLDAEMPEPAGLLGVLALAARLHLRGLATHFPTPARTEVLPSLYLRVGRRQLLGPCPALGAVEPKQQDGPEEGEQRPGPAWVVSSQLGGRYARVSRNRQGAGPLALNRRSSS